MTRIIKADSFDSPARTAAGVLKLTDVAAQARSILLDARKEATGIISQARVEAEDIHRAAAAKAYEEGFGRGHAEGLAAGKRQAQDEARQALAADSTELASLVATVVRELGSARQAVIDEARHEVLQFSVELARRVVGQVAVGDPSGPAHDAAVHNLDKALTMLQGQRVVCVKVNPSQLAGLQGRCGQLCVELNIPPVRLAADESVAPGGVMVLTNGGQIDATLQTQMENIARALIANCESRVSN